MPGDVRSRRATPGADVDPESPTGDGDDDDDKEARSSNTKRLALAFTVVTLVVWFAMDCLLSRSTGPLSTVSPVRPHVELDSQIVHADEVEQGREAMKEMAVLSEQLHPRAVPGPAPETSTTLPATPAPAPPKEWRRHSLQQQAGLPAGPQHPAQEPSSSSKTTVRCATTTGPVTIEVNPDWAPHGAKRFLDMVKGGFFSSKVALFRSVRGFLCQTGVAGDPEVQREWKAKGNIPDDPQWLDQHDGKRMKRGYLSFAGGGKDSRNVEFFFVYNDLGLGTSAWEVPFGKLIGEESFQNMDHWYTGYGDIPAFHGKAPEQGRMYEEGVKYVEAGFPDIDYITACDVLEGELME